MLAVHDENNIIAGLMAVHVDDLLMAGDGPVFEKAVQSLESRCPFGGRKYGGFNYTGVHDRQLSDGTIEIEQNDYAHHMHELEYAAREGQLDKAPTSAFKNNIGELNWLVGQTRIGGHAGPSLISNASSEPTVEDAKRLHKLIHMMRTTQMPYRVQSVAE